MKEFRNGVKSFTIAASTSMDYQFLPDYTRNKQFTIAVSGISAASAAAYIQVSIGTGIPGGLAAGVNLMDISTMRRATSGNSFVLVIDFPLPVGFQLKVLPYSSAEIDITVYSGNF